MPELPEVETVCRGLNAAMAGQRLDRVELRREGMRFAFPDDLIQTASGQTVQRVHRRAKFGLIDLSNGWSLIFHLGMSGRMKIARPDEAMAMQPEKHDHVVFHLGTGGAVFFNDPRRFGFLDLSHSARLGENRFFANMGPEPLDTTFTADVLSARLAGKNTPIKSALLDQRVVAGLGNIYVCEALFMAGISPRRLARTVAGRRAERLVPAIKEVLARAIKAGGSTLRDYAHVDGQLGYFQHDFQAYGREKQACAAPGCGRPIQRIVQSGRSTFFCGHCQR